MTEFYVFSTENAHLKHNSNSFGSLEQLQSDFPASSGWLVIDPADLPADFSTETYTIVSGQLVRASDELIAERQALRLAAETQAVTQARAARYTAETDALLFDAMEQFALDHPENEALAAWLVAKDAVRAELPKPQKGGRNA